MDTPGCAGSNFILSYVSIGTACQLNLFLTCPAGQTQIAESYFSGHFVETTVSNGICGHYNYIEYPGRPI